MCLMWSVCAGGTLWRSVSSFESVTVACRRLMYYYWIGVVLYLSLWWMSESVTEIYYVLWLVEFIYYNGVLLKLQKSPRWIPIDLHCGIFGLRRKVMPLGECTRSVYRAHASTSTSASSYTFSLYRKSTTICAMMTKYLGLEKYDKSDGFASIFQWQLLGKRSSVSCSLCRRRL